MKEFMLRHSTYVQRVLFSVNPSLVFLISLSLLSVPFVYAAAPSPSAFQLLFDPLKNGVKMPPQRIDYDLTKETVLRLGPYWLSQNSVSMQLTREETEYDEIEFGLEKVRRKGAAYILSFSWPKDFIRNGTLEFIDDRARSLWRQKVTDQDLQNWRPPENSKPHRRSHFGFANKDFLKIPIGRIKDPFRYCLSEEDAKGRVALCSRRFRFAREGNQYKLVALSKEVAPRVMVNDKPVTEKGTAIFLDYETRIKFSALLKSGVYFEFVAHPKEIRVVDVIHNVEQNSVEYIGYGDAPMGPIDETFYADPVHWGLLNFMPTIGDLRKFWRARSGVQAPHLYLKGEGGAPFRQNFEYEALPTTQARIVLSNKTTKSTYGSRVWVRGSVNPEVQVSAQDADVERVSDTEFRWHFPAPVKGEYNQATLDVMENNRQWHADYQIYRGYPLEMSARTSGVLTNDLKLVFLLEGAAQYWFESLLGWENSYLSRQRWGISAKYFRAFLGTDQNLKTLAASNFDLKYRLTPGVSERDPTVGVMLSAMTFDYGFEDSFGAVNFKVPVAGGGVFWARSMPKIFDDLFNLIPIFRYPKWVDWETIYYPLALRDGQKSRHMFAMNFRGKIQWSKKFYGEGGFGLKNFSFEDVRSPDPNEQLAPTVGILYGTVGIGFNF